MLNSVKQQHAPHLWGMHMMQHDFIKYLHIMTKYDSDMTEPAKHGCVTPNNLHFVKRNAWEGS